MKVSSRILKKGGSIEYAFHLQLTEADLAGVERIAPRNDFGTLEALREQKRLGVHSTTELSYLRELVFYADLWTNRENDKGAKAAIIQLARERSRHQHSIHVRKRRKKKVRS